MAFLRLALPFVALFALVTPAFATLSLDQTEPEPEITGSIGPSAATLDVEIGAGSSSEIVLEKEDVAPPATTPEDLKTPRQSRDSTQ